MRLDGRTAVVTGSSRSIGAGIAERLAREGASVVVNSRSTGSDAEKVAERCRSFGVQSIAVECDVSQPEGVEELVDRVMSTFPVVDILVNGVGVSPYVPFLEISHEDYRAVMAANVDSMFYTCQAFVPGMVAQQWGRIINITGHVYMTVVPPSAVHTKAGKAAAVGLTRGLAGELGPHNVTVNHLAPGLIDTEPRRNKYYRDDKPSDLRPWGSEERVEKEIPLGRLGTTEDVAALVGFLCGEEAGYLTGQTYLVNGGMMAV